jgi:hypothetical protein
MMRLRAIVRDVSGNTEHLQATPVAGRIEVIELPTPRCVEISEHEGVVYLLRLDSEGECIADTWHETVDAAKSQANFEFGIQDDEWQSVDGIH